jgi:hypothetical protein
MFNSITIKNKLVVLASIPLILALVFSSILISTANQEANNAIAIHKLMTLATTNSELVHELQKERGLTAGFLSSQGNSAYKYLGRKRPSFKTNPADLS